MKKQLSACAIMLLLASCDTNVSQGSSEMISLSKPVSADSWVLKQESVPEDIIKPIAENDFISPASSPFSTFSIDVDEASYTHVRSMINAGSLPPAEAVRIEEMINYFDYDYTPLRMAHLSLFTRKQATVLGTQSTNWCTLV
jgi:hypothetical protein